MSLIHGARHWWRRGGLTVLADHGSAWAAGQTVRRLAGGITAADGTGSQRISQALITGPHATVIGSDVVAGDAVRETASKTQWMFHHACRRHPATVWRALRGMPAATERIPEPVVVLYHHSSNYYHWLVEQMPKLAVANATPLVPADAPEFVSAALRRADIESIRWDGRPLRVSEVVVPELPASQPYEIAWLREYVGGSAVGDRGDGWLFISRASSDRGRRVANRDELQSVFEDRDVEIVQPEQWSLAEQISRFAAADGVIAAHGAGLTNMLWMTDATIIELDNGARKDTYAELATALGHDFARLHCEPASTAREPINADLRVDIGELLDAIELPKH